MVFDRIWNGATDAFRDNTGLLVDLLDAGQVSVPGGVDPYSLASSAIRTGARNLGDERASDILAFVQEDLLGKPTRAQMEAQEPGDGVLPTVAKYGTVAYRFAFDEDERNVIEAIATPILQGWQWAIDNLVDDPLGTVATVVHDANLNGPRQYLDMHAWARAYNINNTERTFGQSFAYAFMGVDPYDDDEYNSIQSDPMFNLFSGTADFVQEFIDPVTYATGGVGKVARGSTILRVPGTSAVIGRTGAARVAIPGVTRIPQPVTRVIGTGFGRRGARNTREAIQNISQARARAFAGTNYTNDAGLLPHRTYQQIEDALSQLDNWQQRVAAFNAIAGRSARNMDERAIEIFARAETPQQRQLTMRVLAGDFGAMEEMHAFSREMLDIQSRFFGADEFVEAQQKFAAGDLDGLADLAPGYTGDIVADLQRYNDLQGYVNWFQMYDMQQALYRTQQRSLRVNDDGIYEIDPTAQVTIDSMDQDLFFNALEDMLGSVDDVSEFSTHLALYGSVREIPFGGRLQSLRNKHDKILETTGDDVTVSTFVNTNNMFSGTPGPQGRVMRVVSERVPQTIGNSSDPNFLEQVSRVLDQARRVNVQGKRLTDEAEVTAIAAEFQRLVGARDFAAVDALFEEVMGKFMRRTDQLVDEANWPGIDIYSRSTLYDDYLAAQKKHEGKTVLGGMHERARQRVVSIQGDLGKQKAPVGKAKEDFSLVHEVAEDGSDLVMAYRISPSQVKTSRVMPRFDVVQRKLERMDRYSAKAAKALAENRPVKALMKGSDRVHTAWRGSMLLRPAWPIRIGIDEQLRMMITMGSMVTMRRSLQGYQDLRRELSVKGLKNMESAGDVTLIARELYDILDIVPPKTGEAVDYYKLFESATDRQFNAAVRRVRNRALRQRGNIGRIALNSGIKGGLFGLAFGADIAMGAGYFGWSVLSRHTRISQQTRRAANISYAAVLRRQAQASMIRAAGDPSAIRAAQSKMTDADFIEQLAETVPEARLAQNQFEAAERLMANAGFPSLRLGGANLRNAFGDDPNFIEQWRGFVSASKARDSLLAGAHRASRRELEEFYSVDWKRWDILDTKTVDDALFAEKWSRMMDLYTGNPIANQFYEIVWSNTGTAAQRADRLVDLITSNEKVFNDLFAPQSIDNFSEKELFNAAKYVIAEYDNVLPPEYFATLRERAMTGKVEWPEIDRALNDIVDSANATLPAGGEQVTRKTIIEAIRDGGGDPNAPVYPHFGKSLGPDPASHANVQKVHDARLFGKGFVDRVYNMLGTMPTDNIARMPFFRANYELEAARRIDLLPVDADGKVVVTQRQLNEIGEGSRKFALKETRTILYDLAENLRMSELMGNTVAFLNAYAEVFSRWAGFAIRQPAEVMGKYRLYDKAWEAEALGLTEVEDPESGRTYLMFSLNQEDPTVFDALPQGLRDQILPPFLESGTIRMSKDGLNTALQGTLPGFGPVATVVLRETMREVPQLEEVLGFIFPFGHPDGNLLERSTIGNLAAWQKSAYNLLRDMGGAPTDENDEIVGRMMLDIYTQAQLDGTGIDLGDPEEVNAWIDEANKRAQQFNIFRIYQGLLAPSSSTILSPYHEFIEIARDLQREHGQREGTRRFLDEHGMDFFALTQRMTRLNDGTAASLQSELLFEKNQELVQAYPDIGAWITGSIGGSGEEYTFSTHVYWRQKTMGMGAGSDANRREVLTPAELAQQLSASRGWYEFFELQEWEREERGKIYAAGLEGPGTTFEYENGVRANPVEVLAAFKEDQLRKLERAFPDWAAEYNNLGSSIMTRRAINTGFAAVLQDETLSQRPSADHILEYYQLRYWVQEQLTARKREGGSDNIETSGNADLLRFWLNRTEQLGNRPGFSHVYDRFFERDRLMPQTFLDPAEFGGLLEYRSY